MSSTFTDRRSRPKFVFVGEHPAIDFANTVSISSGERRDHLQIWTDFLDWLAMAGMPVDSRLEMSAGQDAEALKKVTEFREAWRAELTRLISGDKVSNEFLERLNHLLAVNIFHETLWRTEKQFQFARSNSLLAGEKLALALLGRQIALFLAEANLDYLRRCANTTACVFFFYDTTKNHRRQWCSVATCGNRHKVAQFRKRQLKVSL